MKKLLNKIAKKLIEKNPDKYLLGEDDYGYYNNGVGMACYGKEKVYDEEQAYEDAKEYLIENINQWAGKSDGLPEMDIQDILQVDAVYNFINNLIETA